LQRAVLPFRRHLLGDLPVLLLEGRLPFRQLQELFQGEKLRGDGHVPSTPSIPMITLRGGGMA
jgi:hypothetical protein